VRTPVTHARFRGPGVRVCTLVDLPQYASAARFRLGVAERSSSFATEQRIQRPERMFGVWAPGFD